MKKVKVMLTAIAILAVLGGALAFKAKKFGSTIYCPGPTTTYCLVPYDGFTTTNTGSTLVHCTIQPVNAVCNQTYSKVEE